MSGFVEWVGWDGMRSGELLKNDTRMPVVYIPQCDSEKRLGSGHGSPSSLEMVRLSVSGVRAAEESSASCGRWTIHKTSGWG